MRTSSRSIPATLEVSWCICLSRSSSLACRIPASARSSLSLCTWTRNLRMASSSSLCTACSCSMARACSVARSAISPFSVALIWSSMISLSCLLSWFRSSSASSADTHPSSRDRSSLSLSSSSCLRATMSTLSSSSDTIRSWSRWVSFSAARRRSIASSALRALLRSDTSSLTSFADSAASCCCSGVPSFVAIASMRDWSTEALSLHSASCSRRSSFSFVSLIAFCLCPSTVARSNRALLSSFITLLCFSFSRRYSCRSLLSSSRGTLVIITR
mmetsp:Transcript_62817/g.151027  ORF Transcript_62817/g.151027 Transcript_62817/m.151027 type:complete len:273 (-) Transcript_62817:282-1100(-)